jgi:hypothetical protein
MANSQTEDAMNGAGNLKTELGSEYTQALDMQNPLRPGWDERESMLISKLADSNSPNFKSRVTDSRMSTIIFDRAARVMAQLSTGSAHAMTVKDRGKSALMNLILTNYIQPNDNSQYQHLTKMRMWDMYSMVYGAMPLMYDYQISSNYIGPATWILPIRTWLPQPGKLSIDDSDYNFVETIVSVSQLEYYRDNAVGSWDKAELAHVIDKAREGGKSKTNQDTRKRSIVELSREWEVPGGKGSAAQVTLVTKYEAGEDGHWITFAPDFDDCILRDIENPHKNGRIPIILKHNFPLIDSIYGLSDMERGKTLQFAMDSLINLYMDGVKMSIFPPTIMNPKSIVASSIKYQPGAKWLEKTPNSIRPYESNPQGMTTFQSTYQFLVGSMQSQNGVTDTSLTVGGTNDPALGKTPQAIQAQQQRESARDNWDRYMMEKSIELLYERMINLVATQQEKPINLHIFDDDIKALKEAGLEDVMEVFESGKVAKVTVTKNDKGKNVGLGGAQYKYLIDAGSTMQKDQATEHAALGEILKTITEAPALLQVVNKYGKQVNVGELFKRWFISGGVQDWDKIITDVKQQPTTPDAQPADPTQAQAPGQAQPSAAPPAQPPMAMPGGTAPNPMTGQANPPLPPQLAQMMAQGGMPQAQPQQAAPAEGEVDTNEIAKILQEANSPSAEPQPDVHPITKIMESINYKDLPEVAQEGILEFLNLPWAPSVDQRAKMVDTALKAHKVSGDLSMQAHKQRHDLAQTAIATTKTHLEANKHQHSVVQDLRNNAQAQEQQQFANNQSEAGEDPAEEASESPQQEQAEQPQMTMDMGHPILNSTDPDTHDAVSQILAQVGMKHPNPRPMAGAKR